MSLIFGNLNIKRGHTTAKCVKGARLLRGMEESDVELEALMDSEDDSNELLRDSEDDKEHVDEQEEPSMIWFHIVMATGSVYMSMLLTNWGTVSGHKSEAQMWVSIASQWISMSLYIWTLVAPRFCPHREF